MGDETMKLNSKKRAVFLCLCLFLQCLFLGSIWAAIGENIALHKSYTFNLPPNYALCTDEGDKTDLTDGKYSEGYFWVQPGTVGWQNRSPIITIDLEQISSISGISYSTAAGTANVNWPRAIIILVSDNNQDYYFVGDLVEISSRHYGFPAPQGYSTHRYKTCNLKTKGRYVRLMVIPSGRYTFCDEIEVFEGPEENLHLSPGTRVEDIDELINQINIKNGIRARLSTDIKALGEQISASSVTEVIKQQLKSELSKVEDGLKTLQEPSTDFRAVIPINSLHEELFRIRAKLQRAEGFPELFFWKNNQWDLLTPLDIPPKENENVVLNVSMMLNEFRSEAFNITNFSDQQLTAIIKIDGLPNGKNPDYIKVHQVEYVDTREGVVVGAALPEAKKVTDGYEISLPIGLTRQIWFTFNPKNIPPGSHSGIVSVTIGKQTQTIPLELNIYNIEFPDQPSLSLGMWDYTDRCLRDITPDNRLAAIEDMRNHFVDTPWASRSTAPWPSRVIKKADGYEMEIDYANFEQWIELWEGSRYYAVFLNVGNTFGPRRAAMGTEEFRETVSLWAKLWGQHIRSMGLHPSQFLLLLVDEPKSQDEMDLIIAWAQAIKAGEKDFVIWEDPALEPWSLDPGLFEVSDTLCPNLNHYYRAGEYCVEFYEEQRQKGKTLWFYQCAGPARLLDPYYYHRLLQWHAWVRGAVGVGFWAYGSAGGASSWNEYLATGSTSYTPLYIDQNSVTTGKHWEAIREGVEDYEYLKILKDLLDQLEASGKSGPIIEEAKTLLQEAPLRVIGTFTESLNRWENAKDRSVADRERIAILQAIAALKSLD